MLLQHMLAVVSVMCCVYCPCACRIPRFAVLPRCAATLCRHSLPPLSADARRFKQRAALAHTPEPQ